MNSYVEEEELYSVNVLNYRTNKLLNFPLTLHKSKQECYQEIDDYIKSLKIIELNESSNLEFESVFTKKVNNSTTILVEKTSDSSVVDISEIKISGFFSKYETITRLYKIFITTHIYSCTRDHSDFLEKLKFNLAKIKLKE